MNYRELDGGVYDNPALTIRQALNEIVTISDRWFKECRYNHISCNKQTFDMLRIPSYMYFRKILLTFNPVSPILLSKQGDYSVVEKVKPDPLNLLANTNVGS